MAEIRCPACGTMNPTEQEYCQNCQARLDGSTIPLQPGQAPTKKTTAELEPILPQWLRDARNQARTSVQEEAEKAGNQAQDKSDSPVDLLAGLQAQSGDDEDDVPDWLSNITGQSGKAKKIQPEEHSEIRWVELGGGTEELPELPQESIPAGQAPVASSDESELPPWLANIVAAREDPGQDTLSGWLKKADAGAEPPSPQAPSFKEEPPLSEEPFSGFEKPAPEDASGSGWANKPSMEQSPAVRRPEGFAPLEAGLPDWLKSSQGGPGAEQPAGEELPDWLKNLDSTPLPSGGSEPPAPASLTSDWLKDQSSEEPPVEDRAGSAARFDSSTPDWLKQQETADPDSLTTASESLEDSISFETPDWLKALDVPEPSPTPKYEEFSSEIPASGPDEPAGPASPDWLKDLGGFHIPESSASESASADASQAAFTPEGGENVFPKESLSKGDLDALFTEMPDWLVSASADELGSAPATEDINVIAPGSLPSWVEAMRPVESSIAQGGEVGDQTLETRGPLAGLHGVLPVVPFLGPSSKPKAYSIKLVASEEQQSHAALLEEVLAAETTPAPIASPGRVASQRALRLAVAAVLFLITGITVLAGSQIFPLPAVPQLFQEPLPGSKTGLQAGIESILVPESAAVLVVFDYDPALAGEMQTLAVPLLDQMILLRHPRLTLVSTSPTGAVLGERLITGPLASHNYQSGFQYVNLGYIPGGLSGVRAFAQNPPATVPFAFDGSPPWQSEPLKGVQAFAHFAAVVIITDNAETGRTWIEQAGPLRGASPFVIAASAQAGPLLHPYFQSGQINGLLTGLHDSAVIEQINAGRPGVARRYWDAYNTGLLLAVAFILGGSLMSLVAGLGARARTRAQ